MTILMDLRGKEETAEDVQERIDLTPEQQKAWAQLVRAVNRCKKEKIYFYLVLDTLMGMNGHEVLCAECIEQTGLERGCARDLGLSVDAHGGINLACSFADDSHVVVFHDD